MAIYATQRDATRNQSTVDYRSENIFLYGNRYSEGVLENDAATTINAKDGYLVVRNGLNFSPATASNLADVIGILKIEGENQMEANATLPANYAISGDIDTTLLQLPDTVTLDTAVGNKTLKDILTGLGFSLKNVIELSKYGN